MVLERWCTHDEQLHFWEFKVSGLRHYFWGSGAGSVTDSDYELASGCNGTSVVQANMTNLRLTNLEILVFRFRVRLDQQPGPHQPGRHAAQ